MPFAEIILIILLLTGAAVSFIGIVGHAKITAGPVHMDAAQIRPISRLLLIAGGAIGMLLVLALFPSSLPTYVLSRSTPTIPRSAPNDFKGQAPASPAAVASTPAGTVQVRVYFLNTDRFAQDTPPYTQAVYRQVIPPAVGSGALQELFAGPTQDEQALGLRFLSSHASGFENLRIDDGVARVQLTGGCSSGGSTFTVADEIRPTLKQFPSVIWVKIYDPSGQTERPYGHTDSIPACLEP
jgi:hypothetical protein